MLVKYFTKKYNNIKMMYKLAIWYQIELIPYLLLNFAFILLTVAFYTLNERKIMGSIQRRIGPNKIGFFGLAQPFADGLKLSIKETIIPKETNLFLFLLAPLITLFLSLAAWSVLPLNSGGPLSSELGEVGLLIFLMYSSLNLYSLLIAGWASNNKYAMFASLRAIAQMFSYELVLMLAVMPIFVSTGTCMLSKIAQIQDESTWFILEFAPLAVIFAIVIVAETNRAPFDLLEAEGELIAGVSIEYSAMIFSFFFLGEYTSMITMSGLFTVLFLGGWSIPFELLPDTVFWQTICFGIKTILCSLIFLWIRATFARVRYDQLMHFCWCSLMPFSLCLFGMYLSMTLPTF